MSTWLPFSSVPGMSVPGMACPGLAGTASTSSGAWTYIGHVPVFYLDYIDALTHETLAVQPGSSYSMTPVNSRAGLTIPPPDDCWLTAGNRWADRVVFRPEAEAARGPSRAALQLAAARKVNADLQASLRAGGRTVGR
jgi:hypothetical protein